MALQWAILGYVAAVEAVIAILLTLPAPRLVKSRIVALITLFLQPATGVIPFAGFQLLDLYWKNEHRLMCTSEVCTSEEMVRYEKSILGMCFSLLPCLFSKTAVRKKRVIPACRVLLSRARTGCS